MLKYLNTQIVFSEIPHNVTLAINITNCPNFCVGCHSSYLSKDVGEPLNESSLSSLIAANEGISCVCFMGGDIDKKSIEDLALFIKNSYPKLLVGWYSGQYEIPENVQYFDFIKLGPYIAERGPLTSRNTNQRMYQVIINDGELIKDDNDLILKDITNVFWRD